MVEITSLNMEKYEENYELYLSSEIHEKEIDMIITADELCGLFDELHGYDTDSHRYQIIGTTLDGVRAVLTIDSDTSFIAYSTENDIDAEIYCQAVGQGIFNNVLQYAEYEHVKKIHKEFVTKAFAI